MSVIINKKTTLLDLDLFRLETENITLDNGIKTDVHILRHPGAAAIVPFIDDETVILIKQYRHAVGEYIWEIPAGTFDFQDEAPLACAQRELIEETGYSSETFQELGCIMPSPGYCNERLYIFVASNLCPGQQNLEQDEVLEVHKMPWEQALEMIYSGEIVDAKTISGLLLADHWRRQNQD